MRADQPLRVAATPTMSSVIWADLITTLSMFVPRARGAAARPARGAPPRRDVCARFRTALSQSAREPRLGRRGAFAAVCVFEPDDVIELRRRDLENRRVVDRRHPMD